MQVIVYTRENGEVSVVHPAPEWFEPSETGSVKTMADLAAAVVPQGASWRIADQAMLPGSRNWRGAWTDPNASGAVEIDLERAKVAHTDLMITKALERVPADAFGVKDFEQVRSEIAALAVETATSHQQLFNMWPPSIENRTSSRQYKMYEVRA